jgi:hypothetical protein
MSPPLTLSQDVSTRCWAAACDRPHHTGLHQDADGFRWAQEAPDDAYDRDEQDERAWKP